MGGRRGMMAALLVVMLGALAAPRVQAAGVQVQVEVVPPVVRLGEEATITATVTSDTAMTALLNVELRLPSGLKVTQRYEDNRALTAGTPATLRMLWTAPPAAERGVYLVSVGVFAPGWAGLHRWQDVAAEFVVAAPDEEPAPLPPIDGPLFPFVTLPPGAPLPDSAACAAAVRRNTWEPRPENAVSNQTIPVALALEPWHDLDQALLEGIFPRIDGAFTGTTDEILQWGACKWGFDLDTVRAVAVGESSWRQQFVGDEGASFGLLQVKATVHAGTYPWSALSTALNVDYALAWRRACFEGVFHWVPDDARGDEWGCIGLWYSGRWYRAGAEEYIARIRRYRSERTWLYERF